MVDLISVIIPFYNTPIDDFKECLQSVLNQTYRFFEVIIIDDGSDDNLGKMLDDYINSLEFNNIHLYHIENQGVSVARNLGTEYASGNWITYVDSDDVIAPWMFEHAMQIVDNECDLIIGNVKETKNILNWDDLYDAKYLQVDFVNQKNYQAIYFGKRYRERDFHFKFGPVCRFIKSSIAKKTKFPYGIKTGEDYLWNIDLSEKCKKIICCKDFWYQYIYHDYSAIHRDNKKRIINDTKSLLIASKKVENDKELQKYWINYIISKSFSDMKLMIKEGEKNGI